MAQENVNIQMRLISISEVDFKMSPGKVDDDVVPEAIKIGFSNQFQPDVDNDIMSIVFGIRYELSGEIVLESVYRFIFEVKDIAQFIEINNNESITIKHITPHFLSVAVGTMRGILVVKTAGTNFSKYPLPMIDVNILNTSMSTSK